MKEEDAENHRTLEKSEQERLALLKEANLIGVSSIFSDMMREDPEVANYRSIPQIEGTLAEYLTLYFLIRLFYSYVFISLFYDDIRYEERVSLLTEDFTKSMLTYHANHKKETQQFTRACKLAQSESDKSGLDLIGKFNKNFKKVFTPLFLIIDVKEE